MIVFAVLAVLAFGIAAYYFLKGLWLLMKAVYYRWFAPERKLDEAFKKEVLAKEPEYKKFESDFDKRMDSILNKRTL
ncbi:hypothetical protein SAMN06296241_1362 [Salinimicrobium sediminis]|uniref:Uncharacterized protein n=1 Tax=Salinimicrobium sediminis TaxID=1343891 RepID=A0A285X3E0_9FLAO|nr:hypothetical protein [Salinimicrobium sediminis]SOC79825.1 hypothetical protein SAMN06296241_1362 [Salinimicrobium sediminis]